jgi:hypothetical protein
MTNNVMRTARRSGRAKRLISAVAVTGAALLGVAAAAVPAHAAPAPAAPFSASWCSASGSYHVCLHEDAGWYAAAATGPVGTVVELIGAGGVVIAWDRRESWESYAETKWHPSGRLACVVGGPCATYLD